MFCPCCGAHLDIQHCASCGAMVQAGWKHCASCGAERKRDESKVADVPVVHTPALLTKPLVYGPVSSVQVQEQVSVKPAVAAEKSAPEESVKKKRELSALSEKRATQNKRGRADLLQPTDSGMVPELERIKSSRRITIARIAEKYAYRAANARSAELRAKLRGYTSLSQFAEANARCARSVVREGDAESPSPRVVREHQAPSEDWLDAELAFARRDSLPDASRYGTHFQLRLPVKTWELLDAEWKKFRKDLGLKEGQTFTQKFGLCGHYGFDEFVGTYALVGWVLEEVEPPSAEEAGFEDEETEERKLFLDGLATNLVFHLSAKPPHRWNLPIGRMRERHADGIVRLAWLVDRQVWQDATTL